MMVSPATSQVVELSTPERVFLRNVLAARWDEADEERMKSNPDSADYAFLLERQQMIEGLLVKLK